MLENIRLTNGRDTFLCGSVISDERGAAMAKDSAGREYFRCDIPHCIEAAGAQTWHDAEGDETLVLVTR